MYKAFFNEDFKTKIKADGWQIEDAGHTRSIDYNDRCLMVTKMRKIAEFINNSANDTSKNRVESTNLSTPEKTDMVFSRGGGCALDASFLEPSDYCKSLVVDLPDIISCMRSTSPSLVIRSDVFWYSNPCNVISYNFSCSYNDILYCCCFFVYDDIIKSLDFDYLIGRFLDCLSFCKSFDSRNVLLYEYISDYSNGKPILCKCSSLTEAKENGKYLYDSDGVPTTLSSNVASNDCPRSHLNYKRTFDYLSNNVIPITLLFNYGSHFISSLNPHKRDFLKFNINSICDLNHGIFTRQDIKLFVHSFFNDKLKEPNNHVYLLNITFRDATCLNPISDSDSTPELYGNMLGLSYDCFCSTEFEMDFKVVLHKFLTSFPLLYLKYFEYSNNAILLFICRIWGFNKCLPITATSAACVALKNVIYNELNCSSDSEFFSKYSGLKRTISKAQLTSCGKYFRVGNFAAINSLCDNVLMLSSLAFRGGYNGCFSVDIHKGYMTFDMDICSAYPTAMVLVPAIDFDNPIKKFLPMGYKLSLDDFKDGDYFNPMCPLFALVSFEFPDSCLYPNLVRNFEHDHAAPCYPLSETNPVYCSGPELFIALKLGANITVHNGLIANVLYDQDGNTIYPYRNFISSLINARVTASKLYGKKSLESILYKFITNSLYGKVAQNVSNSYNSTVKNNNYSESLVSNSVSACLITSFIRSVLFASFNEISSMNYNVYSATTDGLITDMPFDKFNSLPLFGLRDCLVESRRFITKESNPAVWEIKHVQDDLYNFSTRGNISLCVEDPERGLLGGVISKNGAPSAFPDLPKTSPENRAAFYKSVVSRDGKLPCPFALYPNIHDIISKNYVYTPSILTKNLSMNFDFKRKPLMYTLQSKTVTIDGVDYEIATFSTAPFKNADEFLLYKNIANHIDCLRTKSDWEYFFYILENASLLGLSHGTISNWKIFLDCISLYRAGIVDIPYLDTPSLSVADKVNWLNSLHKCSGHVFKRKTWDKVSEKSYQARCYKMPLLKPTLDYISHESKKAIDALSATPLNTDS